MADNDTRDGDNENERTENKRTLKDVSHTHPHHDEPFGSTGTYGRGGEIDEEDEEAPDEQTAEDEDEDEEDEERVTDGGRRRTSSTSERRTLADVDHTPPEGVGAQDAYNRGPRRREEAE